MQQIFFETFAEAFARSRYDDLAECYDYPTSIYFGSGVMVFKGPAQSTSWLKNYRQMLDRYDYARTKVTLKKSVEAGSGKSRNWLTWTHCDRAGKAIRASKTCHFCATRDGVSKISMMEILSVRGRNASPFDIRYRVDLPPWEDVA